MSKFCMSCGAQMDDNAEICPSCGANQNNPAPAAVEANPAEVAAPVKSSSGGVVKAALIAAVAVVVVVALLVLKTLFGGSYKDPVDNLCKGMESGKGKYLYRCLPEFMIEEEYDDMKKSEIIDELDEDCEDLLDSLEDTFGDDIKITYKIKDKDKIDKDDLEDMEEDMEDDYDTHIRISKGYELKIKLKIEGDDRDSSNTTRLNVYKVDGDWCFLDDIGSLM